MLKAIKLYKSCKKFTWWIYALSERLLVIYFLPLIIEISENNYGSFKALKVHENGPSLEQC